MANSTITSYSDYCLICGAPSECEHHLIGGTANRKKSDRAGLVVRLCNKCHNMSGNSMHGNTKMMALGQIVGQLAYERDQCADGCTKEQARERFRQLMGKSFL